MNAPQKLAGFAAVLAAVFAAAFGVGSAVGPGPAAPAEAPSTGEHGYRIEMADTHIEAKKPVPLRFRIIDRNGAAVTRYVDNHEKQLHLIVVRRDLVGYQHLHPSVDGNGTWSVPADFSRAGDYRLFADFIPAGGEGTVLGADLHIAGRYEPQPLPKAETTATVGGYTVTLAGEPKANESSMLTLSVTRDGKPVTDLQPYLGAYGHLVALRASDLAYLHVHPMDGTPGGPDIGFHTTFPSAGDYRLFLDFRHNDVVRTAQFTVSVPDGRVNSSETDSGHGH